MDRSKYPVKDEVAEKIINNINNLKFIKLPNGAFINTNQITKIDEVEKKPYFMGSPMTKDLQFVLKDGEKLAFSSKHKDRIEWREEVTMSQELLELSK